MPFFQAQQTVVIVEMPLRDDETVESADSCFEYDCENLVATCLKCKETREGKFAQAFMRQHVRIHTG